MMKSFRNTTLTKIYVLHRAEGLESDPICSVSILGSNPPAGHNFQISHRVKPHALRVCVIQKPSLAIGTVDSQNADGSAK